MVRTFLFRYNAQQYAVYTETFFTSSKTRLEKELHTIQLLFFNAEIKLGLRLKYFFLNPPLSKIEKSLNKRI